MEVTTFIWMFVILKIPVVAALLLIWWAVKEPEPEPASGEDDGGGREDRERGPHRPRSPRRGPHGGAALPPPRRVRAGAELPASRIAR